jgi:integrase
MGSLYKRSDLGVDGNWFAAYVDHQGRRRRVSTGTTDKTSARRILVKLEADAALRARGVIDPVQERRSQQLLRPFSVHRDEFIRELQMAGRSQKHVDETERVLKLVADHCGWSSLQDITAEGLGDYTAALRKQHRSNRTIQKHIATCKHFVTWLYRRDRLSNDVLKGVRPPNPESDRRIQRRALRPDEWSDFLRGVSASGERRSMSAKDRALLYELAIQTGLRQSEVRSLTPGKFYLQQSPAYVVLPGARTKNRKPARQFVTDSLRVRLIEHVAKRRGVDPVFHLCDQSRVAEVIRKDLATARANYIKRGRTKAEKRRRRESDHLAATNHEGETFDFHSLRHTCGAWLAMQGENPKTIQTIMRHSSITLTMDRYGHLFPAMESQAVERLSRHFA